MDVSLLEAYLAGELALEVTDENEDFGVMSKGVSRLV